MRIFFPQTADQSEDCGMGGLNPLIFLYPLGSARDQRPGQLFLPIPQTQQGFDDAKNSQHAVLLLRNDPSFLRLFAPAPALATPNIRRNPEQLVELACL